MRLGAITQAWRYPVKSMGGERVERLVLDGVGVLGDRWYAVRDEERGGIRGAKKIGALMRLDAAWAGDPVERLAPPPVVIRLPDGSTVRSDASDVDARLTAALDHRVTLWPLRPVADAEHYRRGAPDHDDILTELRDMFARTEDEPLPDIGAFPPELIEYESPLGTYVDAYAVLLVTQQSLDHLQELAPESRIDVRRFRPNLVLDAPDAEGPWPEQAWVGHTLRVGEVRLEVVTGCPRCVMITRGFADLPEDRSIMRTVVREADQCIGVYATVATPGTISVDDDVSLVD